MMKTLHRSVNGRTGSLFPPPPQLLFVLNNHQKSSPQLQLEKFWTEFHVQLPNMHQSISLLLKQGEELRDMTGCNTQKHRSYTGTCSNQEEYLL